MVSGCFKLLTGCLFVWVLQLFAIALISSLIIYFAMNLNSGGFGWFLAALFVSLFVAESLMLVLSSIVPIYIVGMAL